MKKYEMLIDEFEEKLKSGIFKSGDKLPSIREIARNYQLNKSTVIKALEGLEQNHRIYSIPKSGYYVIGSQEGIAIQKQGVDFSLVTADKNLLPHLAFKHSINRAADIYKERLYEYSDPAGLITLKQMLANFFSNQDIHCNVEQICIVSGVQQALQILVSGMAKEGAGIVIESPTYRGMIDLLNYFNLPYTTVIRNEEGIDLEALEEAFKKNTNRYFYTMSRYHNPLGHHLSKQEKIQIIELANRYNVYVIEDDYLGDLDCKNKHLPLYYYDIHQRVIYLRSFSKTFMPGLRIGAIVLPQDLLTDFVKAKACSDINTSVLAQASLEVYIGSGMYNEHVQTIAAAYKEKHNALVEQLKYLDPSNVYIKPPVEGFIYWLNLHDLISDEEFFKRLLGKGITLVKGSEFYKTEEIHSYKKPVHSGMRLSIATLSPDEIRHGINIIYDEIKKLTESHKVTIGKIKT